MIVGSRCVAFQRLGQSREVVVDDYLCGELKLELTLVKDIADGSQSQPIRSCFGYI
jgi:hypothetical protein